MNALAVQPFAVCLNALDNFLPRGGSRWLRSFERHSLNAFHFGFILPIVRALIFEREIHARNHFFPTAKAWSKSACTLAGLRFTIHAIDQ